MRPERLKALNKDGPAPDGRYVLYWMQQAQRAACNHALEHAVLLANERRLPLVVGFGLTDGYPEANLRHYAFMMEGLAATAGTLITRGATFVLKRGDPAAVALELAGHAAIVVCDRGYLRHQRAWRERVARQAGRCVLQVEGEVVVPVELATDKAESAARTIRNRINRHRDEFLEIPEEVPLRVRGGIELASELDPQTPRRLLDKLDIDRTVAASERFKGGTAEARRRLDAFLDHRLAAYAERRSEPVAQHSSQLSPYLHFGQISPVEVARRVKGAKPGSAEDRAGFLEELCIRRELAQNWCHFSDGYDRYEGLPAWARRTLEEHAHDAREPTYTPDQLERGETHDRYWNAAMHEMRETGYMHNYMRMYWGKKILEWSPSPQEAFERTLRLNNRFFLDGRDPNSFANVGWIFGLHDRPWTERKVFGKVRYMNDRGLQRKFDIEAYAEWAEGL